MGRLSRARNRLSILSQLLPTAPRALLLGRASAFNSFPVASGGASRRSTGSCTCQTFQFFPSCFHFEGVCPPRLRGETFNSFPVASRQPRRGSPQRRSLSILSQLLRGRYGAGYTSAGTSSFNSFPVASAAPRLLEHGRPVQLSILSQLLHAMLFSSLSCEPALSILSQLLLGI